MQVVYQWHFSAENQQRGTFKRMIRNKDVQFDSA